MQQSTLTSAPLVSIITPVFNAEKTLLATVESVLAQSHQHWELLLVVDEKSSDRSLSLAREMAQKDSRIQVLSGPHCCGIAANRNAGLNQARGEYLAFLDADDRWLPRKLELQLLFMQRSSSVFSFHSYYLINWQGERLRRLRQVRQNVRARDLLKNNTIGCLTVMLQRDFLGSRRFANIPHEDLNLWLDLLSGPEGATAHAISEPLAEYRLSPHSTSGNKLRSALWRWQLLRRRGLAWPRAAYYLGCYLLSGILKRF